MSCKWMMHSALTLIIANFMAGSSLGQYQTYSASTQFEANPPQRAQLPWWSSAQPAVSQSPQAATTNTPYAYSPSEMPSVNPFANMRSQQQNSGSHGNLPSQPAADPYHAYATSFRVQQQPDLQQQPGVQQQFGVDQQPVVGNGIPYSDPTQQVAPSPQPNSFYDQPAQNYWQQQPDYGFGPKDAGCSTLAGTPCRSGWYGGVFGMVMNRSRTNNLWLSYDLTDIRDRVLSSNDADFSSAAGAGANIGHYFNCGKNSIEFVYWGVYPGTSEANAFGANTAMGIDRILHFDGLQYDAGTGLLDLGDTFFFNAERHRVQRSYDVNNFELNLLGHNFTPGCGPLQLGWLAGLRYLRFDEDFLYSSDVNDVLFTGAPEEVHYGIDAENNLVGCQFGGQANYCVGPRLGFFANTKVGLYGNHMRQHSRIYGSNGTAIVGDPVSPYLNQDVDATATRNSYSMIGDLSVGANWYIKPCWSINAGYRVIGVSGVALSTNQVPVDFIGALDSIRTVNSNGCLILHGAFAGINYCY